MKPRDLKRPFKWEEREPVIQDGVFHVPAQFSKYECFTFPEWHDKMLFGNNLPVKVEYCSGNGAWIAACSLNDPNSNWIAVEKKFERVSKIWSKKKKMVLNNLITVCGEGYTVTKYYFREESVSEIFINFPDPWPKTRHAKNRIVQQPFIEEMWRILQDEGTVTIVTDDENYSEHIIKEMSYFSGFISQFSAPYYKTDLPGYGTSYFDELWRSKGKQIRYHQFVKKGSLNGCRHPETSRPLCIG